MDKPLVKIKYKTADGQQICVEVSTPVAKLLEQSDRQIRSQRRQDRRHLDFEPLTEERLENSLLGASEDTADLFEKQEHSINIHKTMDNLTEVQKRRLYMRYILGFSCKEIAEIEKVSRRAVSYSIRQALDSLKTSL